MLQDVRDVREVWDVRKHFILTNLSSDTLDAQWLRSAEALWSSPMILTHDGLTYDRANSSPLQATAAHGAHGQMVVNDAKLVINDMTNLSEGLPVINNTNAKMTFVVVLSINVLMTCVVAGLCGLWPV